MGEKKWVQLIPGKVILGNNTFSKNYPRQIHAGYFCPRSKYPDIKGKFVYVCQKEHLIVLYNECTTKHHVSRTKTTKALSMAPDI